MASEPLPTYKKTNLQMVAYRRIQNAVSELLTRFHMNTTQWIMLGVMSESANGMRVTDMARVLQVEMPFITITMQSLVAKGLMRTVAHARDKRAKLLMLTPKGRQVEEEIEAYLSSNLQQLEKGVNPQDLKLYFKMLQQIGSNASMIHGT